VFGISDTTVNIVDNVPEKADIKIYPNPANSVLNFDFSQNYNTKNSKIEIVDIHGKTMLKSRPNFSTTQLDIKELNPGLYIVKIQNSKTLITRRIVIQ
jgi:hypothetical protein